MAEREVHSRPGVSSTSNHGLMHAADTDEMMNRDCFASLAHADAFGRAHTRNQMLDDRMTSMQLDLIKRPQSAPIRSAKSQMLLTCVPSMGISLVGGFELSIIITIGKVSKWQRALGLRAALHITCCEK